MLESNGSGVLHLFRTEEVQERPERQGAKRGQGREDVNRRERAEKEKTGEDRK